MKFRIAILVPGRFHAFDLARELLKRGHDVVVLTNYPAVVAARFGVPQENVRSFVFHGAVHRLLVKGLSARSAHLWEPRCAKAFGRWAARQLQKSTWDVIIGFSGVSEEAFSAAREGTLRLLERGSAHIRTQHELLLEEETRAGYWVEKPSEWMVAREEREYALADAIQVLSGFALQSFIDRGVDSEKLFQYSLGVNTKQFRASPDIINVRCRRIRAGEPLRVLNVGTFSHQKGARDLVEAIKQVDQEQIKFRFVGTVSEDAKDLKEQVSLRAEFRGKRSQCDLPHEYEWGDVFVLPSIQDGFAVVLRQAQAAGLPLVTSTNCGGPDLVQEGRNGLIVPIRSPDRLAAAFRWIAEHREETVEMVRRTACLAHKIDWSDTACQAEANIRRAIATRARTQFKDARASG